MGTPLRPCGHWYDSRLRN